MYVSHYNNKVTYVCADNIKKDDLITTFSTLFIYYIYKWNYKNYFLVQ